jgi:hypothetical protein
MHLGFTGQIGKLHSALFMNGTVTDMVSYRHKARFFQMDFSAAVSKIGTPLEQRKNGAGVPSYINVAGHQSSFKIRNGGPLIGRDAAGDWWMQWPMRADAWPAVEKRVQQLADEM